MKLKFFFSLSMASLISFSTFAQYKKKLTNMGYNIYAQLGSIGGSKTAGIIRYEGDEIVRQ